MRLNTFLHVRAELFVPAVKQSKNDVFVLPVSLLCIHDTHSTTAALSSLHSSVYMYEYVYWSVCVLILGFWSSSESNIS